MTRRTTRIAGLGAGAFLALGLLSAAPAGASDGAQADATVSAPAADLINQTLGLVNQACLDANQVGGAATSALSSEKGISVAASPAGGALNLDVLLPQLTSSLSSVTDSLSSVTGSLPLLGSLPLVGSVTGQASVAAPLQVACDSTTHGLSVAGVEAIVHAIAPGIDLSSLGLDLSSLGLGLPALGLEGSATTGSADPGTQVSATAAPVPAQTRANVSSAAVRASAANPATRTTTAASAAPAPASASGGIVAQTVGSPGALARTGAGVGVLGLLGTGLLGSGRLLALGRRLLKIG